MPVNKEIKFHQIERTEETPIVPPKKERPTKVLVVLGVLIFLAPLALVIKAYAKPKEKSPGLVISTIEEDIKAKLEEDLGEWGQDISRKLEENISKKLERDISAKLEKEILARLEKDIPEKLSQNIPNKLSEDLSEKLSQDISKKLEKKLSGMLKKQSKKKKISKPKIKQPSYTIFNLRAKDWKTSSLLAKKMEKVLNTFAPSKTLYLTKIEYIAQGKDKKSSNSRIARKLRASLIEAMTKHPHFKLQKNNNNSRIYARYFYRNNTLSLFMVFYGAHKSRKLVKLVVKDLAREKKTRKTSATKPKKIPKGSLEKFKKEMAASNKLPQPKKQIGKLQPKKPSFVKMGHGKARSFSFYFSNPPRWTKNSYYRDAHYHGSIEATCVVSALDGGGLKKMKEHLESWTNKRALSNHPSHPNKWVVHNNFFKYDVQVVSRPCANYDKDITGMINMNFMCYLGYKKNRQVIFLTKCEKITFAKGKKERLKAFQSFTIYARDRKRGHYKIYVRRYFKIKAYWYEPSGIFIREVRKETLQSFKKDVEKRARKWAFNL